MARLCYPGQTFFPFLSSLYLRIRILYIEIFLITNSSMSSETIPIPAIKRRQRPQPRARASSIESDEAETVDVMEEEAKLPYVARTMLGRFQTKLIYP